MYGLRSMGLARVGDEGGLVSTQCQMKGKLVGVCGDAAFVRQGVGRVHLHDLNLAAQGALREGAAVRRFETVILRASFRPAVGDPEAEPRFFRRVRGFMIGERVVESRQPLESGGRPIVACTKSPRNHSHSKGLPTSLTGPAVSFLFAWKWVLLYTAAVFLSLPFTRSLMDALESRGLQGLLSFSILFGLLALVVLFFRFFKSHNEQSRKMNLTGRFWVLFAAFVAAMACMTSVTVERIHFFEYGLLAFLCFDAAGRRRRKGFRRFLHAGAAAVAVGFLDEAIQGLLPNRYYDSRDLLLNLTASGLVLLGVLALFPGTGTAGGTGAPKNASGTTGGTLSRKTLTPTASDGLALLLLAGVGLAFVWIRSIRFDPDSLAGCWERRNPCDIVEVIQIDPSGSIFWRDESGGQATGTYEIGGNRLDGPLLRITVKTSAATGDCAWAAGRGRDRYYKIDGQELLFRIEPSHPFQRCGARPF